MSVNLVGATGTYSVNRPYSVKKAFVSSESTQTVKTPALRISFKGNPNKKPEQIAAASTESNFLGGIYTAGGLGDVAEALPDSAAVHAAEVTGGKKIDIRTFLPYYTFNDSQGRIYVLTKEGAEKAKNLNPGDALDLNRDFKLVPQDYKLQSGEQFALITEVTNKGDTKTVKKYFKLKDTSVTGSVERMAEKSLDMETVPYRVFEVDTAGKRQDKIYVIHTTEHAKGGGAYGVFKNHCRTGVNGTTAYGSGAYGSSAYGGSGALSENRKFDLPKTDDMFYTEFMRSYNQLAIEGKMDNAANGNFNPQNHIFHDRFCYSALTDIVQKAKNGNGNYSGLKISEILHNPGASYQGKYYNPLDFFRIIATSEDLEKLKSNENFAQINEIAEKIEKGVATEEESTLLFKFFKPYLQKFMDTDGNFNMTMIAVRMTGENPQNSSIGNVSINYGKETRNPDTADIAKGLTEELIKIHNYTVDVVNGSRKANMGTDEQNGFFGRGSLEKTMNSEYKPFKPTDSAEEIFNAKLQNKKPSLMR